VELSDGDGLSLGRMRRRRFSNRLFGGRRSLFNGRRGVELFSSSTRRTNHDQVLLSKGVLAVPRVELDDALDLVEGVDIDVQGLLGDEEHDTLSTRRSGQGSGVLEHFGGLHVLDKRCEVKGLDFGLGSWGSNGSEMGLKTAEERVRGAGCKLEKYRDDGQGIGIGWGGMSEKCSRGEG
jgi:hypothetical protein